MKKINIPLFTAPESHQKPHFWTFLWPMGKKLGLGEKKVIEMTPPLKSPQKYIKIIKKKKIFFLKDIYFWSLGKKLGKIIEPKQNIIKPHPLLKRFQ